MKVLATIDESELSLCIIPALRKLAAEAPVEMHLVTVLNPGDASTRRARSISPDDKPPPISGIGRELTRVTVPTTPRIVETRDQAIEELEDRANSRLHFVAHEMGLKEAGIHVVWADDPAEVIVGLADELDADMIAMATHGRSGVAHLLAGSVAEGVIRTSERPVLTVRPTEFSGTR